MCFFKFLNHFLFVSCQGCSTEEGCRWWMRHGWRIYLKTNNNKFYKKLSCLHAWGNRSPGRLYQTFLLPEPPLTLNGPQQWHAALPVPWSSPVWPFAAPPPGRGTTNCPKCTNFRRLVETLSQGSIFIQGSWGLRAKMFTSWKVLQATTVSLFRTVSMFLAFVEFCLPGETSSHWMTPWTACITKSTERKS